MCACTWGGAGDPSVLGPPQSWDPRGGAVPSAHPHLDPPPHPRSIASPPIPIPTPRHSRPISPHMAPPPRIAPHPTPHPPPYPAAFGPLPAGPCPDAAHKGPRLQVAGRDKAEPKWGGESNHLPPTPKKKGICPPTPQPPRPIGRGHSDGLSHGNPSAPLLLPVLGVIAAMGGIWGGSGVGKGGGSVNYCAVSVEEASLAHGKPLTRKPCTGCDGGV